MNRLEQSSSVVATFVLATLAIPSSLDAAQAGSPATYRPATESGRTLVADSTDDGPHIYWQSDSAAVAFYLCGGEVLTRGFFVKDTLRFQGFCGDSSSQYVIPARRPPITPHVFHDVSRMLAISDIHGEYEALVAFLVTAGIIDENLHWLWGDGHLVVDGDVLDRGDKVTECLWLLYRLEQEASQRGGRVHFLLGNHETMVMLGDNRYINKKYIDGIVRRTKITHQDLYGPDMELGRWLRSKHTVVKLNDVLFVHAGIPPWYVEQGMSLDEINEMARANLDLKSYEVAFNERIKDFYGGSGPFWYRGYHYAKDGEYPQATPQQVDATLTAYGVSAIVVGHTGVDRVIGLYGGKVFGIDIPLDKLGSFEGLLWKEDRIYRVTGTGQLEMMSERPR
jgi:hypothetical protein